MLDEERLSEPVELARIELALLLNDWLWLGESAANGFSCLTSTEFSGMAIRGIINSWDWQSFPRAILDESHSGVCSSMRS